MRALLAQHTEETGQAFTPNALEMVWEQTRGQPWLVNGLADEACFRNRSGRDRTRAIDADDIRGAREQLILHRETHLDQLADKLQEERVRRVVEPLLSGGGEPVYSYLDLEYARDLGLVARDDPVRVANPIYGEVIPRQLTSAVQSGLVQETAWYVDADGCLDVDRLLAAFQAFFREHAEHWVGRFDYREAGPQLLLQAFLQRIVNGGGYVEREYGLGRGRVDLLIVWPQGGRQRRFVVECKVVHKGVGADDPRGGGADRALPGALGGGVRSPRGLRPRRRLVGREYLPPRAAGRGPAHRRVGNVIRHSERRNSSTSRLTSADFSCCTQCPAPSSRCRPRRSVQACVSIRSMAPGRWWMPQSCAPAMNSDGWSMVRPANTCRSALMPPPKMDDTEATLRYHCNPP